MTQQATGARLTGIYEPANVGNYITFLITGFTMTAEDRPTIDATSASDTIAYTVPGRRGQLTVTINARFDADAMAALYAYLSLCSVGRLSIKAAAVEDCDDVPILGTIDGQTTTGFNVFLMGFNIEATMESSVDITMNFVVFSDGTQYTQVVPA